MDLNLPGERSESCRNEFLDKTTSDIFNNCTVSYSCFSNWVSANMYTNMYVYVYLSTWMLCYDVTFNNDELILKFLDPLCSETPTILRLCLERVFESSLD